MSLTPTEKVAIFVAVLVLFVWLACAYLLVYAMLSAPLTPQPVKLVTDMPALTQTDLDALDATIASGALEVRYQDRSVRYASTKDLLAARSVLYNQLHPTTGTAGMTRQVRVATSKGV